MARFVGKGRVAILSLCVLAMLVTQAEPQKGKLLPVDEASKDPSLVAFRARLLKAVEQKDGEFVLNIVDPRILLSFGSSAGIEHFKGIWKPDRPDSELWDTLKTILNMGGCFVMDADERRFYAPYVACAWPEGLDAVDHVAITASGVRLREQPSMSAPIVAVLSFDIVRFGKGPSVVETTPSGNITWLPVSTAEGKEGYVSEKYTYHPWDYRACFAKRNGKWVMTLLVAGD